MINLSGQLEIDYIQEAQYRVCADTRLLKKRATLTLPANSETLALPAETLRIEEVYGADGTPIVPIPFIDYLRLVTSGAVSVTAVDSVFCVIGRTMYFWPTPTIDTALTVYYSYRPAPIDSSSTMEVSGTAERLIERLTSAYILLDDGQPELAQAELGEYYKDASRLRHQDRRAEGYGGQLQINGRRRR